MTNSPLPINGKELAARWNIKTVDLLYIMLNHGLNVVDQRNEEQDIGDVLEDFKKNKDASDYMFRLSEVKDIEAKLEVDGEIPHAETIRGKDLMARWDTYDLPFKVKGFYLQDDYRSSNDILDKLKTNHNIHNNMVNQIVPSDQWDEEIMSQRLLKALAEGRVNLDEESTRKLVEAIAAGRVCFLPAGSFVGLDIKSMGKITIH